MNHGSPSGSALFITFTEPPGPYVSAAVDAYPDGKDSQIASSTVSHW